jgi:hypothetical protein
MSGVAKGAERLRNLSRVSFGCPEPQAATRPRQIIRQIEFAHADAKGQTDKRIIVEITTERLTFR